VISLEVLAESWAPDVMCPWSPRSTPPILAGISARGIG
jgi:hypothetical protein